MPGEFTNPSYINPAGGGSGEAVSTIRVSDASSRLALLQANAQGRVVKQMSDFSVWCLKPNGSPSNSDDWELIGYFTLGSLSSQAANNVAITGGSISGVTFGSVTWNDPAAARTALGLGSVNNTADSAKPVSTAQASAIAQAKTEAINTAALDATAKVNAVAAAAQADAAARANAARDAAIAAAALDATNKAGAAEDAATAAAAADATAKANAARDAAIAASAALRDEAVTIAAADATTKADAARDAAIAAAAADANTRANNARDAAIAAAAGDATTKATQAEASANAYAQQVAASAGAAAISNANAYTDQKIADLETPPVFNPEPVYRHSLEGPPVDGEAATTMSNLTIRFETTSNISVPGGSVSYAGVSGKTMMYVGQRRWTLTQNNQIYFEGGYWNILLYVVGTSYTIRLRAVGLATDDPASLSYVHAPASDGSGGAWTLTPASGYFTGFAGTVASRVGQLCRVGPYELTAGREGKYDWYVADQVDPTVWSRLQKPTLQAISENPSIYQHALGIIGTIIAVGAPNNGIPGSVTTSLTGDHNDINWTGVNGTTVAYQPVLDAATKVIVSGTSVTVRPGTKSRILLSGITTPGVAAELFYQADEQGFDPANGDLIWTSNGLGYEANFGINAFTMLEHFQNADSVISAYDASGTLIYQSFMVPGPPVLFPDDVTYAAPSPGAGTPSAAGATANASQVIAAVAADAAASALIAGALAPGNDGTGAVSLMAAQTLSGGVAATLAPPFLRVGGGKGYLYDETGQWKEFSLSALS